MSRLFGCSARIALAGVCAALSFAGTATAADYPSRPIKLVAVSYTHLTLPTILLV